MFSSASAEKKGVSVARGGNSNTTVETLECGSSLAELEHHNYTPKSLYQQQQQNQNQQSTSNHSSVASSLNFLRDSLASDVITASAFQSPFEETSPSPPSPSSSSSPPLVYCDQTASNRVVKSMEDYLENVCWPLYGNTHTNTSVTGSQTTAFVSEARQIVAESCNAKITGKAALDIVLFAGNGTTSAVELLIDCMGLRYASPDSRPVVFIGPYEHHSNLLPWRESGCEIVVVPEHPEAAGVDLEVLDRLLQRPEYEHRLKMGAFSAASNVTGIVADVPQIARTLHRRGALAFFDYATGAPYLRINMNPTKNNSSMTDGEGSNDGSYQDALFISPHKMVGGVGTPGVLIVKKALVNQTNAPKRSGGGTVFYVTNTHHRFLSNRIERYEGGTPNITGILRTGLAFLLKRNTEQSYQKLVQQQQQQQQQQNQSLPPTLEEYEFESYRQTVSRLQRKAPRLLLLGNPNDPAANRLPIFSFLIRCGKRFLHYNYVCAILNDVFGIQSRGGCQCAGPYSQKLLGLCTANDDGVEVPNDRNRQVEHALLHWKERAELLRPGYTRLSLPFKGLSEAEAQYVEEALVWVSQHAWKLMHLYRCNHRTGEWRHFTRQGKPLGRERKWLSHYNSVNGNAGVAMSHSEEPSDSAARLAQTRENADKILREARSNQQHIMQAVKMNDQATDGGADDSLLEELRWFVYPKECATWLRQGLETPPETDSAGVMGAIRPSLAAAIVLEKDGEKPQEVQYQPSPPSTTAILDTTASRKRRIPSAATMTTGAPTATNENMAQEKDQTAPPNSNAPQLVLFRDGEHSGEAPIDEIEAGFDDGELSKQTEIYEPELDSWVQVEEYLRGFKKKKSKPEEVERRQPNGGGGEETDKPVESTPQLDKDKSENFGAAKDEKNEKKKPSRDSTKWGQSQFVPIKTQAVVEEKKDDDEPNKAGKKRKKGIKPPSKMMRLITQAMIQWDMVEEGDRLLLGLSGGKDSLSLLHCLLEFQRKLPINFDIEVCTIDPMTPSFDPSPLIPYVESLGLKYHYIRDDIVARASSSGKNGQTVSSLCAFCARMKRGNLYTCARQNKCNKLVLAQHLDDCAESFLMSVMHNGFLRTMKAHYQINAGDLAVIRPMVYCRESLMTEFAKSANLPVINENCPACFEEPKERARIKKLLTREETLYPNFYDNIKRSLIPLMHDDATAIMRCYTEEVVAKSRKENHRKVMPKGGKDNKKRPSEEGAKPGAAVEAAPTEPPVSAPDSKRVKLLSEFSEEELVKELARRKADKFRLSGSMKRLEDEEGGEQLPPDPTGQVCSLNGGDGSIPCRELME